MTIKKKHLMLAVAATLPLAACNNGAYNPQTGSGGPTPPGPAQLPLVSLVNQMFAATNDTASPIEINTLPINTSDESPTLYNGLII